jgi:tRNA-splicing ligase RtcB
MQIIEDKSKGVKVFSWCPDADEQTINQISKASSLPFVRHAAIMPDAHLGNSICIGGVVACEGVVVPDFVGADCGCGMCMVKTSVNINDFPEDARWRYLERIEKTIPVGFSHNDQAKERLLRDRMGDKFNYDMERSGAAEASLSPLQNAEDAYFKQVGTLGSGNHMAEVDVSDDGAVWILIHSGSRNIGKRLGDFFNEVAFGLNRKFYSSVPDDIAFLPTDSPEGRDYLRWMEFALSFAFRNREVLVSAMKEAFIAEFPNVTF